MRKLPRNNSIGADNVFEACRQDHVGRIGAASTIQLPTGRAQPSLDLKRRRPVYPHRLRHRDYRMIVHSHIPASTRPVGHGHQRDGLHRLRPRLAGRRRGAGRRRQRLRRGGGYGRTLNVVEPFMSGVGGIGTPGSWGILQTTPQMLLNALDYGMNVQQAIEAPRFSCITDTQVTMEERFPTEIRQALARYGNEVQIIGPWSASVGGAQAITADSEQGIFQGGADSRRDGAAFCL